MKPDRIIIGSDDGTAAETLDRLYQPFNRNHDKVLHMDVRSAEMAKYAANVMLATQDQLDERVRQRRRPRWRRHRSRAPPASAPIRASATISSTQAAATVARCFPKDARALVRMAAKAGYDAEIVRGVEAVNERQKHLLAEKLLGYFRGSFRGCTLAVWGLAFKPDTNDMREAPSRALLEAVWRAGGSVRAYDPQAMPEARRLYGDRQNLVLCERRDDALEGADALAVVTEWREFRSLNLDAVRRALARPVVFDGRNLYDPRLLAEHGIDHIGIGRGNLSARHD